MSAYKCCVGEDINPIIEEDDPEDAIYSGRVKDIPKLDNDDGSDLINLISIIWLLFIFSL